MTRDYCCGIVAYMRIVRSTAFVALNFWPAAIGVILLLPLLVLLLVPTICIATSRLATRAVLRERPLALLQAAEA